MNKVKFIISSVTFFIGLKTLLLTSIVKNTIPKLGFMAYQIAAKGSYDQINYDISFITVNIVSGALLILGLIGMIFFGLKENKIKS